MVQPVSLNLPPRPPVIALRTTPEDQEGRYRHGPDASSPRSISKRFESTSPLTDLDLPRGLSGPATELKLVILRSRSVERNTHHRRSMLVGEDLP